MGVAGWIGISGDVRRFRSDTKALAHSGPSTRTPEDAS